MSAPADILRRALRCAGVEIHRRFVAMPSAEAVSVAPLAHARRVAGISSQTFRTHVAHYRPKDRVVDCVFGVPEPGDEDGPLWLLSPIDGVDNVMHRLPTVAVCAAYREAGRTQCAGVYDPIRDELFLAQRCAGALLNDRRIRASADGGLGSGLAGVCRVGEGSVGLDGILAGVAAHAQRHSGCPALDAAYLAAGRYNLFVGWGLNPAQVSAAALLVREAGGLCDADEPLRLPSEGKAMVAGTQRVFAQLTREVAPGAAFSEAGAGLVWPAGSSARLQAPLLGSG